MSLKLAEGSMLVCRSLAGEKKGSADYTQAGLGPSPQAAPRLIT